MKKIFILTATLFFGILSSCTKTEVPGKSTPLNLTPRFLDFTNKGDTAIVSSDTRYFWVGGMPISENWYQSKNEDTLYDGWIKIIALEELKQVKVIVFDNNTGIGRYYIAHITGGNTGANITVFQSK